MIASSAPAAPNAATAAALSARPWRTSRAPAALRRAHERIRCVRQHDQAKRADEAGEHVAPVEHRPQERPAQKRRCDVGTTCRLDRTAQPAEKALPAAGGFGVSYSHWIPRRAAAGQLGFPRPRLSCGSGFALA
jgi:hypothetical protein